MGRIGAGLAIIIFGLFAGTVAFWAPAVDPQFGMGDAPAWQWTTERALRHVLPAAVIVVGGVLLLVRSRASQFIGIALAVLGSIWVTIAPIALGTLKSETMWEPGIVVARKLAHHFGIGPLILGVAMFALGWLVASGPATKAARRDERANEQPLEPSART